MTHSPLGASPNHLLRRIDMHTRAVADMVSGAGCFLTSDT